MSWVAGVDGCPKGWIRICREVESGALDFGVFEDVESLWQAAPHPEIVAIDMPIGLPASGARACDRAARKLLGERRSSVFPAPVRPAIVARDRDEASRLTEAVDGRRVGAQAWGIYPKIRALDLALREMGAPRERIREVHPELSFMAWNGGVPMAHGKRTEAGRAERLQLVEGWLGEGLIERARNAGVDRPHPKKDLDDDDILDAVATLWSAHRIRAGRSRSLPADPEHDDEGLPMEIVY